MPDSLSLLGFVVTSVLLALSPGPDNFYVLAQSATHGVRAGLVITLGLCTGLLVHSAAVAFGLAAVVQTSPAIIQFLQWVGAGYLFYLAIQLWRSSPMSVFGQPYALGVVRLYRKGVFLNLTNPKVSLFFLSFLPQFVSPDGWSPVAQIFALGLLFMLSALVVFSGFSLLGSSLTLYLNQRPKALVWINRFAALSLSTVAWLVIWSLLRTGN